MFLKTHEKQLNHKLLKSVMFTSLGVFSCLPSMAYAEGNNAIRNESAIVSSQATAENIDKIVEDEIGLVFSEVLEDAGVY